MIEHAVVIAGGGPTGMMLASELALAGIDVAIVERRTSAELVGSRAGGLHARTLEVLDQRGIVERFLTEGKTMQTAGFAHISLNMSDWSLDPCSNCRHSMNRWNLNRQEVCEH